MNPHDDEPSGCGLVLWLLVGLPILIILAVALVVAAWRMR